MEILIILSGACIMAVLSRMAGGGFVYLPLGLDQHLYAVPYAFVGLLCTGSWWFFWLAYATAFLGKRTGHGQYMDLGTWSKEVEPETLDFIVEAIFGKDNYDSYWRDFFGLTITGLVVALGATIALIVSGNFLFALLILLGASLKSISYMIGWKVHKMFDHKSGTEIGELLTGFFAGLSLVYILLGIV